MIAVDTNVLVAASLIDDAKHDVAVRAMGELTAQARWALPWIVVAEFYSVTTSARLWRRSRPEMSLAALDAWIATPGARLIGETLALWPQLRRMLAEGGVRGRQVHDARIAAVCLANGVSELWTVDRDFSRYPELRTRNPLVG